jgi:arylsulfatase A-like enzyme
MKLSNLFMLTAALAFAPAVVNAQNESLTSIFTNAADQRTAIPRRASVILITCRGLAWSDLSCYGQTNFQTPNLDRLAKEGARFANYRAGGDELPPAQAALMTGSSAPFTAGEGTLAARLRAAGYHTGLIGEWALGAEPWTQGFDEFLGFLNESEADNYYSDFIWRYAPRNTHGQSNQAPQALQGREQLYANAGGQKGRYIPDLFLSAVNNFIRANAPGKGNHYRPFFLMLNLPLPHSVTPGRDEYPVPTDAPFTGENWPQSAKNRAALLTRLDDGMAGLFDQLQKVGMTNNVAIFLTGAMAPMPFANTNLNFLKLKGEVRGGPSPDRLRVPMVVRWPGHVPAGRVISTEWSASDFAPTAAEIAYLKPVPSFTGVSMLPTLSNRSMTNAPSRPENSRR